MADNNKRSKLDKDREKARFPEEPPLRAREEFNDFQIIETQIGPIFLRQSSNNLRYSSLKNFESAAAPPSDIDPFELVQEADEFDIVEHNAAEDARNPAQEQSLSRHKTLQALAGGSLSIPGAILTALETGPWFLWGYSVPGLTLLAAGGWLIIKSLRSD